MIKLNIVIIIGLICDMCFVDKFVVWLLENVWICDDMIFELVDLCDYDLLLFNEVVLNLWMFLQDLCVV